MSILKSIALATVLAIPSAALADSYAQTFPDHPGLRDAEANALVKSLDYKHGKIALPGGQATLTVPEGFYFLDAKDSQRVLTDLWGNPPDDGSLGMVFPAGRTPAEAWGVEFTWDGMGYVSDKDAQTIDYDAMLAEMKRDTADQSKDREAAGYGSVRLVGWAEPPSYDATARKLHWAMEVEFDGDPDHILNYQLRALGREGVLQATFIAGMDDLPEIEASLPAVAKMIAFNPGQTYADFNPSVDTVAAMGIGGLIAGKAAAKLGLLPLALVFFKKAWFILLLPFIWLKNLFTGRRRA